MLAITSFNTHRRKGGLTAMDTLENNVVADYERKTEDLGAGSAIYERKTEDLRTGSAIYERTSYDKYSILAEELKNKPAGNYSILQAERLAERVLEDGGYTDGRDLIPIIELAAKFGFSCFREPNMAQDISGNIFVGGTTEQVYNVDKVIVVGDKEERPHQRFIIAHELGHYLMDYLGSDKSKNPNLLFSETYPKQHHDSQKELRADRFAAELLMPMRVFVKRYMQVTNVASNDAQSVVTYLARLFGVKQTCIRKRIGEVFSYNSFWG